MKLCTCLMWWRPAPAKRAARPAVSDWVNATVDAAPDQQEERVRCCGWFDSSHELTAGLLVTEHSTPERVANEVPLGWWLDWQSRGDAASAHAGLCPR